MLDARKSLENDIGDDMKTVLMMQRDDTIDLTSTVDPKLLSQKIVKQVPIEWVAVHMRGDVICSLLVLISVGYGGVRGCQRFHTLSCTCELLQYSSQDLGEIRLCLTCSSTAVRIWVRFSFV